MSESSLKQWQNWHKTTNVGGPVQKEAQPNNGRMQEKKKIQNVEFNLGLQALLDIVKKAMDDNIRIRAYGSKWSLNNAAYTKDYMVKTWGLNYAKIGLAPNMVTQAYQNKSDKLCFVQTGVMIKDLNKALKSKNLSLKTTGASDGQRLVGAISAGTHGSAMNFGAMQDFVKGIHLVIPDGDSGAKHIFLQRKSDQAVNSQFAQFLSQTELVLDDDLFNAAVISFGCFGLIHGLLIETEALFLLRYQTVKFNPNLKHYNDILQKVLGQPTRGNLRKITAIENGKQIFDWLKGKDEDYPYFFSVNQNPYKGLFPRTFFVQVMEKEYYNTENPPKKMEELKDAPKHEKHEAIHLGIKIKNGQKLTKPLLSDGIQAGLLLFQLGALTPSNANHIGTKLGTPDVVFHTQNSDSKETNSPCPASSTEIAVPIASVNDAVNCIIETMQTSLLAAPLGIRYIPKSLATLAINQYDDITVTIELPGPQTGTGIFELIPDAELAHHAIFHELNKRKIPHRFHWGQQYPLNTSWVTNSYGIKKVTSWKNARAKILTSPKARNIFANEMTDTIGLT